MFCHDTVALRVRIDPMVRTRSLAVDGHSKVNRFAVNPRAEDKVQITGLKMKDYLSSSSPKHSDLLMVEPFACKAPIVQSKMGRLSVELLRVSLDPT
jgi:hypothetical protein